MVKNLHGDDGVFRVNLVLQKVCEELLHCFADIVLGEDQGILAEVNEYRNILTDSLRGTLVVHLWPRCFGGNCHSKLCDLCRQELYQNAVKYR